MEFQYLKRINQVKVISNVKSFFDITYFLNY